MLKDIFSPKTNCRVLLSNDDGIDAPGLVLLEKIARSLFKDVWVVAPANEQSARSRSLSVHNSVKVKKCGFQRFAVEGTPVDCVILAAMVLMPEKPDLVLSGINAGSNLAEDIGYSGTVGCAFEAALHDIPAVAFSQCYKAGEPHAIPWSIAEAWLEPVLSFLWKQSCVPDMVYNVNFPSLLPTISKEARSKEARSKGTSIKFTHQGRRFSNQLDSGLLVQEEGIDNLIVRIHNLRSSHANSPGSDLVAIEDGHISITRLGIEHGYRDMEGLQGQGL